MDVQAFQHEAAILATCRDPHICQFLGACFRPVRLTNMFAFLSSRLKMDHVYRHRFTLYDLRRWVVTRMWRTTRQEPQFCWWNTGTKISIHLSNTKLALLLGNQMASRILMWKLSSHHTGNWLKLLAPHQQGSFQHSNSCLWVVCTPKWRDAHGTLRLGVMNAYDSMSALGLTPAYHQIKFQSTAQSIQNVLALPWPMTDAGLEPATFGFEDRCSIHWASLSLSLNAIEVFLFPCFRDCGVHLTVIPVLGDSATGPRHIKPVRMD